MDMDTDTGVNRNAGTKSFRVMYVLQLFFYSFFIIFVCIAIQPVSAEMVPAGDLAPHGLRDGQVNAADAIILTRFINGDLVPTANELLIGNVAPVGAPDGELNAADLSVLMRAILGEIALGSVTVLPDPPTLTGSDTTTSENPYSIV